MEGPAKLGIIVGAVTLLLFGGIIYFDQRKNAIGEGQLGTSFPIQGREHIAVGAVHETYNSNPPTSGSHYAQPAEWGIYDKELADEQLVHNLEHGGINIFYVPGSVDSQTVEKLQAIQRDFPTKTVFAPRAANASPIAITSWGYLLELQSFDETQIREFIRVNKNKAPEFFPD